MGILSWFNRSSNGAKEPPKPEPKVSQEVPGLNGEMKVPKPDPSPADISVFEFGSVVASADKVTLAGFCPVSDDLEPCRWEILPASDAEAPQFRVVF